MFCGNISVVLPESTSGVASGHARVYQDGNEIKNVRRIIINIEPNSAITATLEIFPTF